MLNKKGWGLRNELVIIVVIVVCLIIAFFGFSKLGLFEFKLPNNNDDNGNETEKFNYENLEVRLKNSTEKYIKDVYNNELGLDRLIIKASLLRSKGYLSNYTDEDDKYCTGYCEVYLDDNDKIVYEPYVKCGKYYESNGYLERKDDNE